MCARHPLLTLSPPSFNTPSFERELTKTRISSTKRSLGRTTTSEEDNNKDTQTTSRKKRTGKRPKSACNFERASSIERSFLRIGEDEEWEISRSTLLLIDQLNFLFYSSEFRKVGRDGVKILALLRHSLRGQYCVRVSYCSHSERA